MRVLLISANEELLPDPVFPLGLAFLAGALEAAGHHCRVHDLCTEPEADTLAAKITEFEPQVLCISLRNIDNVAFPHSTSYVSQYAELCKELRGLSPSPIVLGGAGFSLFANRLLDELAADYGIIGSGEEPLVELLAALENNRSPLGIANLLVKGEPNTPGHRQNTPLPTILPSRRGFPQDAYYDLGGMANVQTKRGCSFGCVYCSYPLIEGRISRARPVADIIQELKELAQAGYDEIYFVDSVFNYPVDHTKELCRAMLDCGLKLRWTCYGSPLGIDAEMIRLFKESGCIGIEFGTDALSEATLKGLGKSFTIDDARRASSLCHEYQLPFCHAILAGGPGETLETFRETADNLAAMEPTAVVFMTGIRIIPETKLHELALAQGVVTSQTDMLEPVFYLAEAIRPHLDQEVRRLARLHTNWIFPGHSIRSSPLLAKKLRKQGVRGPLWLNLVNRNR